MGRKTLFNQPVKSYIKTSENIRKIATGQGYDFTTGCLLNHNYFKNYYKMKAIDLSKHEPLNADPKAIQIINFTTYLDGNKNRSIFYHY